MKEKKFPHNRKPSHRQSVGSSGISEGNMIGGGTHRIPA